MEFTPNDLKEPEFVLKDKLIHKDLMPFIKEAFKDKKFTISIMPSTFYF